jgi:hypothetical protein
VIRDIKGANTKLTASAGKQQLSVFFESLAADEFVPLRDNQPRITNLECIGK